jgi:hypothetical protein
MEKNIGARYPGATGYVTTGGLCLLDAGDAPRAAVPEFAHAVSLRVNPRIGNNPRWLWEAVALYEAGDFVDPGTVPSLAAGDFPTLAELNAGFDSGNPLLYRVGYTLAEFVVRDWGRHALVRLIQTNGNLPAVLGMSADRFEEGWRRFVAAKYLEPDGPPEE